MRPFSYERPSTMADVHALLATHGAGARLLAGGTDLIIRLRDGSMRPQLVVDIKGIEELADTILVANDRLVIGAKTTMTDIAAHPMIRREYTALAEAAAVVGSVQIRNRATLAGNICNASPAADTAPALLVYGAQVVVAGPGGARRIPIDGWFVRSGVTTMAPDELVTAIELPVLRPSMASVHLRRTRRRGHDLASVTLACAVGADGVTRLGYGSVGPRPVLREDRSGVLANPRSSDAERAAVLDALLDEARPSPTSMRASPEYRLAMLRVLALRGIDTGVRRLQEGRA